MQYKSAYIWGLVGKFGPQIIYLATTMVLARFLTPEDFGMIGVLSIIFVVANVLLDSGLGGSLIKEKEISKIDCSSIAFFNIVVSLLIYIVLFFTAPCLESLYNTDGLAKVVKVLSLVFPITALGIVPKSLLQRDIKFKTICWNYFLAVCIGCITSIVTAILGFGVYALVLYQIVTNLVNVIANAICVGYKFSFRCSISSLKRLLPFGIFTSIISIVDTIYENLMTSLIGKYMSVQQAGYMYQAKRIEETLSSSMAGTIGVVTFPILTRIKDDLVAFVKESLSTIRLISLLSFPILMTVAVFADEIIVLLFGKDWLASGYYLKMLSFAGLFVILETLIRNMIKALCEVQKLLYATIVKRVAGILIMIIALIIRPEYIVYGYIISALLGFLINSWLLLKLTKMNFLNYLQNSMAPLLISLSYFFALTYFHNVISLGLLLGATVIVLFAYYLLVFPKCGIKISAFFNRK